jgi:hypothetical protein
MFYKTEYSTSDRCTYTLPSITTKNKSDVAALHLC